MQFSSTENIDIIREVLNDQRIPNIGHLTERYFVKKVNSFIRANDTSDLMEANKKFINELLSSIHNDTIDSKGGDEGVLPQKLIEDNYGNLYRAERPSTPTFEDKKDECPSTLERELNEAMAARNYDQNIYNTRENVTNKIVIDHESDVSEIEESIFKEPNEVVSKEEEGKKLISRLRIVEKSLNNILKEVSGNGLKEANYTNLVLATERLENSLSQVNMCL